MTDDFLGKLCEHNTWANLETIRTCAALTDAQLDAEPRSVTKGTIRRTLVHLVHSQEHYLALLTGEKPPFDWQAPASFQQLAESARLSGAGILALVRGTPAAPVQPRLQTEDGYYVEPWVVVVQIINHATEHREQINSMLTDLGITPPELDGWSYGEVTRALVPIAK